MDFSVAAVFDDFSAASVDLNLDKHGHTHTDLRVFYIILTEVFALTY